MSSLKLTEVPGFVDLQVNGYKGCDFSSKSLTLESFENACWQLIKDGTIGFLPTIITAPIDVYEHVIPIIVQTMNNKNSNLRHYILGIHLEGPFISNKPGAVGCHRPQYTKHPNIKLLQKLINISENNIRLITIAAELPNAKELAQYATNHNIIVSLGHQLANYNQIHEITKYGAKLLTHLGNAMPHKVHRHNNPLIFGLAENRLMASIICDGYHLPLPLIKLIISIKGFNNIILVSDVSPVAGLPNGNYNHLGIEITINNQHVYQTNAEGLAGSGCNLYQCVKYLLQNTDYDIQYIIQMSVINPLRLLKYSNDDIIDFIRKHKRLRCDKQLPNNLDLSCVSQKRNNINSDNIQSKL
eukprot:68065_1